MATMNISLPDPLRDFVNERIGSGDYATVSDYMRDLVRKAKIAHDLEKRLLSALEGKDLGEVSPEFFADLKARIKGK